MAIRECFFNLEEVKMKKVLVGCLVGFVAGMIISGCKQDSAPAPVVDVEIMDFDVVDFDAPVIVGDTDVDSDLIILSDADKA